jgi:hypothetical protein
MRFFGRALQRPNPFDVANLGRKKRSHGHDFTDHRNPAVSPGAASVAVQVRWGCWLSGGLGLILLIIIILALTGHLSAISLDPRYLAP